MKTIRTMLCKSTLGKWAYGGLFTVLLPALLALWAWALDAALGQAFWPLPLPAGMGAWLALLGLVLMIAAMRDLWVLGKGLPMNAFPPERLVHQSIYAWLRHPIYVGFVLLVAGVSVMAGSRAGFWILAPMMALACAALVLGYEEPAMRRRFGAQVQRSVWLGLPLADVASGDCPLGLKRRLAAAAVALGPWACVYALWAQLPAPIGTYALRMQWELALHAYLQGAVPQATWMTCILHLAVYVYSATYVLAVAAPLFLPSAQALRRYVISAWLATAIGFACMLLWPASAALLPMPQTGVAGWLAQMNRTLDADWLACPSFHMVWATLAVLCLHMRFASGRWLCWGLLVATAASCVLTGSHAVVDVLAGVLLAWMCWHHLAVWAWMVRVCERLANAWDAVQIGPVRIINHATWSALAAGVGLLLVAWLVGQPLLPWVAAVFWVAILAAGAWGYWLEGGSVLSRPFGYYGFLLGAAAALLTVAACDWHAGTVLMAAFACAAPLAQAIGRVRCLVQGCCHGRPVFSALGLCVRHPRSRVAALSHLLGVPIHPTQLYSIVGNIIIFAVLWRMWQACVPGTCIAGLYLMLSSLARFIEEQYRGEVQTRTLAGLAVYQWLAVGVWLAGMAVSVLPAEPVHKVAQLSSAGVALAIVGGTVAAFLMSVDFPQSRAKFSRLTVDETTS